MLERDEADLTAHLAERPGQAVFVLRRAGDDETAMAALRRAAAAVRAIPHPDEPDEPLPNGVDVLPGDDGPTLHLDLQDHAEYADRVVAAIVAALDESGVDGHLKPVRPAAPPFEYDAGAHILSDVTFLETLDERGLPPAFPEGFPIPTDGILVIAQHAKKDIWEHAGWRHDRPFDEYPDELRRFGCELELVAESDPLMRATGMTRHLLRHPTGTGSVSTYHEYDPRAEPTKWYVSVVWRPAAG
ncbi:hypothetical protein ACNTMW_27610 [Planosporangium sp. 12N6]|uniref:hypothetical protein n=1 Tax=Planosporangium spinosum TaxID=3402278 RepID=UPI003CF528BC